MKNQSKLIQELQWCGGVFLRLACCLAISLAARAGTPPVVTGVTATQRAGTSGSGTLVDINYTISDANFPTVGVFVLVSQDSGATWTVPATTFTGDYGSSVSVTPTPAVKTITWNAGTDWGGHFTFNCRVRVLANNLGLGLIPGGTFTMGDTLDGYSSASPHTVTISSPYYADSVLVTGGKWNEVVGGYADGHGYTFENAGAFKAPSHPVQTVNWLDAIKWCNARSEMEGLTPAYYTDATYTTVLRTGAATNTTPYWKPGADGYRLPTEAEWEMAARGGATGERFPWGDEIYWGHANYYAAMSGAVIYDVNGTSGVNPAFTSGGFPYTSEVTHFLPNGYGLYDMAGNVSEWCWDWYSDTYYTSGQTDPLGPASGSSRVVRGGSWDSVASACRCANRSAGQPSSAGDEQGFRCVRGL